MPAGRNHPKKASLGSFIMSLSLQTVGAYFVYIVLLAAFLVIGYLAGNLWPLKQVSSQTATAPAPSAQTQAAPQAATVSLSQVKDLFNKSVIKFGDANSKNIVVEAADPSCPYCHAAAGKDPELAKQMGPQFTPKDDGGSYDAPVPEFKKLLDQGKISYAYVYFPGHGNGEMGMRAFYCAFENNKFWEVHDLLMSNAGYNLLNDTVKNDKTKSQDVADFLASAIDPTVMKSCLDSGKYDAQVGKDQALASGVGVGGTPTYFINDKQEVGALSFETFQPLLASN